MLKYIKILFILFIFNVFAQTNFIDPTTTPTGTPPNLSAPGGNAGPPQVATDASGKYAYCVWMRSFIIQVAISQDYGVTWSDPTTTPTGSPPDLTAPGENASAPQIATDASGKYVYCVWYRNNGSNDIIQVAISQDYGVSWSDPTTTPTGSPPDLSDAGESAHIPQVATDASGKYVYCVWYRYNGPNSIIQVAISQDYGVSWSDPTTTPTGSTPDLSDAGENALSPQIATDASGKYAFCVWYRNNGTNDIIQVAISQDYGVSWSDPTATPSGSTPDLSDDGGNASDPQITTDASGKYVYCVWSRNNGANYIVQAAISHNNGVSWATPVTTPTVFPSDLSVAGEDALHPQIATDATGKYVYCVWFRNDIIQVAISQDYGVSWSDPSTTPTGSPPNLTSSFSAGPQITTDATGKYVYSVWYIFDGVNAIIQVAISQDYGVNWSDPTITPTGITPNLSEPAQEADLPQIATNATGQYAYSVWRRYNGTNNIIQVAVSQAVVVNNYYPINIRPRHL